MTREAGKRGSFSEGVNRLLWEQNPADLNLLQRFLLKQLRTVALVFRDFAANQCLLRASALTYYTMLSLVPLLALTFALLKAFGVQNLLQPLILEKLNVGDGRVADTILGYINNTQVGGLGTFGLIFLGVAVISLLTNIEKAFNSVWGIETVRPPMRRFADYLSVVLVGPVLIISAISMTSTLASNGLVQRLIDMQLVGSLILLLFKVAPFLFMWLAFTGLYLFMTNIRVEWRAAFVGGVVGGTLWQLAQLAYVHFQVGVGRYNAIYGTMAALPIFMVWLYLSWVIVLFGLGVCYARQNLRTSGHDLHGSEVSPRSFERVALAILTHLADRFIRGEPALSQEQLASLLSLPPRLCRDVINVLLKAGFVAELSSRHGRSFYQLGRSAEDLTLADVFSGLRSHGRESLGLERHARTVKIQEAYDRIDEAFRDSLKDQSLKDFVQSQRADKVKEEASAELIIKQIGQG